MESLIEQTDCSQSMGPVVLMSYEGATKNNDTFSKAELSNSPYNESQLSTSPGIIDALGCLSVSSIAPADGSQPFLHLTAAFSPEAGNVLASTIQQRSRPVSPSNGDLSLSMGPLELLSSLRQENEDSAVDVQVSHPRLGISVQVQTEPNENSCEKCKAQSELFEQKLKAVQHELVQQREEKERYIATQQQVIEEYRTDASDAAKHIEDLKVQLEAADKQLKASRVFLEQQAEDREQEREEAVEHLKRLQLVVVDKERERERERVRSEQLALEVQVLEKQLQDKDVNIQEGLMVQKRLEEQIEVLGSSKTELAEEFKALQQVFELKSELLEAQALQLAALSKELEQQVMLRQQLVEEISALREVAKKPQTSELNDTIQSSDVSFGRADHGIELPSLFSELQALTTRLTRKVDRRIRELENVHCNGSNSRHFPHNSILASPRSAASASPITEDVSLKDRTGLADSLENLHDDSQSPSPDHFQENPEHALTSLQQLDTKLGSLCRMEEAAYKKITDLEAELHRMSQAEKKSSEAAAAAQRKVDQQHRELEEVKNERKALQHEYSELLRKISLLENRLEEQRRNPALTALQNEQREKLKLVWEEKQQLLEALQSKSDVIASLQQQLEQFKRHSQLQEKRKGLEIEELHKQLEQIKEKFDKSARFPEKLEYSVSSEEHMRHAAPNDGSLTFTRITAPDTDRCKTSSPGQEAAKAKQHLSAEPENLVGVQLSFDVTDQSASPGRVDHEKAALVDEISSLKAALQTKDKEVALLQRAQENCYAVEARLTEQLKRIEELEAAVQHRGALEAALAENVNREKQLKETQQQCTALQAKLEELSKTQNQLQAAQERVAQAENSLTVKDKQIGELRTRIEMLEAQNSSLKAAQQGRQAAEKNLEVLQKENVDLKQQMAQSENAKSRVEAVIKQLQSEVDFLKQHLQQLEETQKTTPQQQPARLAGPAAPPDLLAPSFIEFLGSPAASQKSSRVSSRASSVLFPPGATSAAAVETTLDCSLPSSMLGKRVLKSVQQESEQLLLLSQKVLQQQGDEDLDSTLTPENVQKAAQEEERNKKEQQLMKRIEYLEAQLSMERLLVQDQRVANTLKQQQIMELMKALSQQRLQSHSSLERTSSMQLLEQKTLKSSSAKVNKAAEFQYRCLKAESFRKNLIYQKQFLIGLAGNFQKHLDQTLSDYSKVNRFRSRVWVIIAILRLRFLHRLWQRRRGLSASS